MTQLNTVWHRECTDTDLCGIRVQMALEDSETGVPISIPEPTLQDPECPLCSAPFGPWIAGPAPEDDE